MRRLFCVCLIAVLPAFLAAQTTTTIDHRPAVQKTEAPAAGVPTPQVVNDFMAHMFGYDPNIKFQVAQIKPATQGLTEVNVLVSSQDGQQQQVFKLYVTSDGSHAVVGDLIPFGADPFAAAQRELQAAKGPSQGPANAALTIVEFGDLQCPVCKAAQPTIEKLLSEMPNARLVFQQFPLPMHNWAMKAAKYGECVARQNNDAFFKFMKDVYAKQDQITLSNSDEQLKASAAAAGLSGDSVAACAALPAIEARVKQSIALGNQVDVTGTPTLFLNGRKIANVTGMPYEVLKNIAEYQAAHP